MCRTALLLSALRHAYEPALMTPQQWRSHTLDADSALGIAIFILALVLTALVAAAEAGVASASRVRLRAIARSGVSRAEALHGYVDERASILGALAIARNIAVVLAAAVGTFLVLRWSGHRWPPLVAVIAGAVLLIALLDALPRLVVARSPEVWGMRVVPVVRVFRMVFGPFAWAIDRSLRSVVPHNGEAVTEDGTEQILRIVESEEDEPIEEEERQMI